MKLKPPEHRAIYFWAGPGTVRMNLLKHNLPLNEAAHLNGYGEHGLEKLVEMGISVAYCTFNWGFAPEIEAGDWEYFAKFAALCHTKGIEVFAYIQSANLVWDDWFARHPESRDWLVRDRHGKPIVYAGRYPRRYHACFNNPGWRNQIASVTRRALDCQTDGVFYDNVFIPKQGCYCRHCREGFARQLEEAGLPPIAPESIEREMSNSYYREWIRFRCRGIDGLLTMARKLIDSAAPGTVMTSNTFDIVNLNRLSEGLDPRQAIAHQDLWMIENFTFPQAGEEVIINNARTYKAARALGGGKPVTSVAYLGRSKTYRDEEAIEPYPTIYTPVYAPDEYRLGIAEAAAHQAGLVIKGTEYYDKYWTVLTEERFAEERSAIGQYHRFLAEHKELYGGASVATVGLVYHQDSLCWTRAQAFPSFAGFAQTLFRANIQHDILAERQLEEQDLGAYRLIILPHILCLGDAELEGLMRFVGRSGRLLVTGEIATHDRNGKIRAIPIAQELLGQANVTHLEQCPGRIDLADFGAAQRRGPAHFRLPRGWQKLAARIVELGEPVVTVESDDIVAVTVYEQKDRYLIHVVNYNLDRPAGAVKVKLRSSIRCVEGYSPDGPLTGRLAADGEILTVAGTRIYDVVAAW